MFVALLVAAVAAGIALIRGGSLDSLATTRFGAWWLLISAVALQFLFDLWEPRWFNDGWALFVVVASNALLVLFIIVNRRLPGMWPVAIGLALNLVVITANQAMPVSTDAARAAGTEPPTAAEELKHERMNEETVLPWLGDVFPVPVLAQVLSVGDLFLALGLAWLAYSRTRAGSAKAREPAASG